MTDKWQGSLGSCTTASFYWVPFSLYRSEGLRGQPLLAESIVTLPAVSDCSHPQWPVSALQQSTLIKLYNQGPYIISYLSVIKQRLILIMRPPGQLLATTILATILTTQFSATLRPGTLHLQCKMLQVGLKHPTPLCCDVFKWWCGYQHSCFGELFWF